MYRFLIAAVLITLGLSVCPRTLSAQSESTSAREQDRDQDQQQSAGQEDAAPKQDSSTQRERQVEVSSSKDTRVDLSPPAGDDKKHPQSGTAVMDAEDANTDVQEMHAWDPHKAAKDVEVGDFYY